MLRVRLDPPLPEPVDPVEDSAKLSPLARSLIEALAGEARSLRLGPDVVGVELERQVADPFTLEPLLDRMARLARALSGREAAGPFR